MNLIPNAQIEDELFNTLAEKKVDVAPRLKSPMSLLHTRSHSHSATANCVRSCKILTLAVLRSISSHGLPVPLPG